MEDGIAQWEGSGPSRAVNPGSNPGAAFHPAFPAYDPLFRSSLIRGSENIFPDHGISGFQTNGPTSITI